jgi:hypothetical protein
LGLDVADDGYLSSWVKALQNVPLSEAIPFGAGATPQGDPTLLSSALKSVATIPQRAIEGSTQDVQHLGEAGYQPQSVGPAADAAITLAGAGAPAAEAGAAGIFGGRLAKTANLDKLSQAERMVGKGQDRGMVRQLTGWHQGPDSQWRFEIPDEGSRMMYPDSNGPAGTLFQHNELYKAYPNLKNINMYSETNPNFPSNTGSWSLMNNLMELSSKTPADARLGALHEMQHAVQHHEGFTPGATQEFYSDFLKDGPPELRDRLLQMSGTSDPGQLYYRTAGEVEARNASNRANFDPKMRHDVHPWDTQDVEFPHQLTGPAVSDTGQYGQYIRMLRGEK